MALAYFEPDDLKKLSDVDLIRKHQQIVEMVTNASKRSTPSETMQQLRILEDAYTAELDRRYEEGLLDEDEIDSMLEEEFDV
jgi:hypothetical protein